MNKTLVITGAIAAASLNTSFAEERNIEEEVIVTANKVEVPLKLSLPTSHIISAQDIERRQPRDLGSLLGNIGGIDFRDTGGRGSASGIFLRGTSSSQVVVLIDGVRSASATLGSTALENIPVEAIERIEVVKGPLSGLYGADAVGGVVQIFTKKGSDAGLGGDLHVSYGSHNSSDYGVTINAGTDKYQFFASLAKEETDGIDRTDIQTDGNGDRDSFEETSGNLSVTANFSEQLKAQLTYLRSEGTSEFDNAFGADNGRFSESELESIGAKVVYSPLDNLDLSLDLGYFSDHAITPVFASDIQTRRRSMALQGDIQLSTTSLLTLGVDYYDDNVDTLAAFVETERDNEGYFVQWLASFDAFSIATSVRYDDNQAYGDDTNGSLALSYKFAENLELVASAGTAFKAPTFNDLYFPNFGNPDVTPEESQNYELALRGFHGGVDWRLSAYRSNVDDLIGFDLTTFTANNTSEATLEGVELELATTLSGWDFEANLNYLDARDDITNEYLDDRASLSAAVQAGRQFNDLYIGVNAKAEHGRHDREGETLGGFSVWGVSLVYDVTDNFKVSGRVDNIFDKDYTLNLASSTAAYETEGTVAKVNLQYSFN